MILCICLTAISQVSAENADNITLTSEEPIQEDVSADNLQASADELLADEEIQYKSFNEVQNLIDNAQSGSTVKIEGRYKGSGIQITIDKPLTIEGGSADENYTYLSADGLSRIFHVTSSDVVLKNLVLRDGDAGSDYGGAVYCDAETNCLLDHCIVGFCEAEYGGATYYCDAYNSAFFYNYATYGGAMYGGNAELCGFGNNSASERGGAMYVRDGVTIYSCEFENNSAEYGGALYSCAGYNTVDYCTFSYNTAGDDGGAIYNNDEYYSGLTVIDSDFRFNEAADDGGAIYTCSDADTTVKHGYFWSNKAGYWGGAMCNGVAFDSSFYMNKAERNGGGMYGGESYDCKYTWNTPNEIYDTDAYVSVIGSIQLSQAGSYFGGKTVSAKVVNINSDNSPIADIPVTFKFSNGKSATVYTNSNGVATYNVPFNPGTYKVTASISSSYGGATASLANIKIAKAQAKLNPTKLKTYYEANKKFKVKVVNTKTKKGISGVKLVLKVYTGKKVKKVRVTTGSNGYAYYNAAKLKVGKHKVIVSVDSSAVSAKAKKSQIKVKKAKTATYAQNSIAVYKKSGKYYIFVANKHTGKGIKGIKATVKVGSGKNAKTFKVKTNKYGEASINTKSLKVGKYKVTVKAKGNSKYKKSTGKGTLEISKKMPTYCGYYVIFYRYSYGYLSGMSVNAYVKDMNGKELHKKITVTHTGSGSSATGYTGSAVSVSGGAYGSLVIKFAGDKNYRASTYTIYFT